MSARHDHIPGLRHSMGYVKRYIPAVKRIVSRSVENDLYALKSLCQAVELIDITFIPTDLGLSYMTRCTRFST
jgi:hypothetical protein